MFLPVKMGLWQLLTGLALRPWWSTSPCRPRSSVHLPPGMSSPMSFAGFVPCLSQVMPRSRTELLPWEELGVTRRVICAKIVCTVQKKTLSCTDSPTAGNGRARPWHSLGEGAGQDLLGGPAVMPALLKSWALSQPRGCLLSSSQGLCPQLGMLSSPDTSGSWASPQGEVSKLCH